MSDTITTRRCQDCGDPFTSVNGEKYCPECGAIRQAVFAPQVRIRRHCDEDEGDLEYRESAVTEDHA